MKTKIIAFINAGYRLVNFTIILPLLQVFWVKRLRYYSRCSEIPVLRLRQAIEENSPKVLAKNQRFVKRHPRLNYSKFDSVFFDLLEEYETIRGDNNSLLMIAKLKRVAVDRYRLEVCKRMLYLYDYSETFQDTLTKFGYSGPKEHIKRKLLVLETNTELKEARLKQSITDNSGSNSTFMDEVLTVRQILNNMDFDLSKMSAKEWAETYRNAVLTNKKNKTQSNGR